MRTCRLAAVRTVLDACAAENIPAMPVKGIVTSALLYDDATARPMFDVDVRVLPSDHARVATLIRKKGWRVLQSSRVYSNHTIQIDGVEVDFEGYVGPRFVCRLSVADMLARATWSDALGFRALLPDFTDHIVLLIVNVFKDKLELARTWALRDLTLVPHHSAFDLDALIVRIREAGIPTIAWLVADWLVENENCAEWSAVRHAVEDARDPAYVRLFRASSRAPGGLASRVIARAAAERTRDRVRAVITAACWELEQRVLHRQSSV